MCGNGIIHRFRNRVLSQLAQGSYQPVLDDGLVHCLSTLPWWQDSQQLAQQQHTAVAATAPLVQLETGATNRAAGGVGHGRAMPEGPAGPYRKHIRARIWLKRQRRSLGGPGKLVL